NMDTRLPIWVEGVGTGHSERGPVRAVGNGVDPRAAVLGQIEQLGMIETVQVTPFPTAALRGTAIQELLGRGHIVKQPLGTRLGDVAEVDTAFGAVQGPLRLRPGRFSFLA